MTDFDPSFAWKLTGVPNLDWPVAVIARQNMPPASAATNDAYIIGEHPTGEWKELRNQIAVRNSEDAWVYIQPQRGRKEYVRAIKKRLEFDGKKWAPETSGIPAGGATGYVLKKNTDDDYDVVWAIDTAGGGGSGGLGPIRLAATSENVTGTDPEGTVFLVLGNSSGSYYERGSLYERVGETWVLRGSLSQVGIPQGGTSGQVLAKTSSTSFAVAWVDPGDIDGGITSVSAGTGLDGGGGSGDVTLSVVFGTTAGTVCEGNDSRLDSSGVGTEDWVVVNASGSDDTSAIQAAFDAVATANGGTVYFPDDDYQVGGALQDTSRSNAQLLLPRRAVNSSTQPITIRLLGPKRPNGQVFVAGTSALPSHAAVIRGTLNTGAGSLIGAWGPSGSYADFTGIRVEIENLVFRMPANPTKSAVDLSHVEECWIDGVRIDASENATDSISLQSTSSSFGLRLPANNNGASTEIGRVDVVGYYNGIEIGEHTRASNIGVWGCRNALTIPAAYHASLIDRLLVVNCKVGMLYTGEHTLRVAQFDVEHDSSGTWTPTYDVSDASNYARGSLMWHTVLSGTGISNTFLVNGAAYLKRTHLYYDALVYSLTDAATVTIDCSIASQFRWTLGGDRTLANPINPHDGQVINVRVLQDGTGNRVWTLGTKFEFAGSTPTLSTAANAKDFLSCQYDAVADSWHCSLLKSMVPPPIVGAWNAADTHADIALSNSNRTATKGGSNATRSARGITGISATGSGYFEVLMQGTETTSNFRLVGIAQSGTSLTSFPGGDAVSWGYYEQTGNKYTNNSPTAYGSTYTNGDVIQVAFNNGSVWFGKNNTWQNSGNPAANTGAAFTGITGTLYPMISLYKGVAPVHIATGRFKTADFTYSPPSGFSAWEP